MPLSINVPNKSVHADLTKFYFVCCKTAFFMLDLSRQTIISCPSELLIIWYSVEVGLLDLILFHIGINECDPAHLELCQTSVVKLFVKIVEK